MSFLSTDAAAVVDTDNPLMAKAGGSPKSMSAILNEVVAALELVRSISTQLGASISATTSFLIQAPNVAAVLAAARFVNSTAFAISGSAYWTFTITNLGQAGAGTAAMLAATATTFTGGNALAANTPLALPLSATAANLVTAAGDVLQITATKTGSPAPLTLAALAMDFSFAA